MTEPTKITKRFSWKKVDPRVMRAMLDCAYREQGREDELKKIHQLGPDGLASNAKRALGEPPRPKVFTPAMAKELRATWLPLCSADALRQLTLLVQAGLGEPERSVSLRNRAERLSFLDGRRNTANLRANMRSVFLAAHKADHRITPKERGPLGDPAGPIPLQGRGEPNMRTPYDHQDEAWRQLGRLAGAGRSGQFCGRVVLPTGSGKTDTAAVWLLEQLAADPDLRVLWITHQHELIGQALTRFQQLATHQPSSFSRVARRIHAGGSAVSTLAAQDLDVVAITIQTLGKVPDRPGNVLERFLERPTIVVVDEAHHAGSPTYDETLDRISGAATVRAIIGLTATPYPTSMYAKQRFATRFPVPVIERTSADLIEQQILARPVLHIVETGTSVTLSPEERRKAVASDLPPEALRRLDQDSRNSLIIDTWAQHSDDWGKTLVFATSIDHANALGARFATSKVPSRVLHSEIDASTESVLAWFRALDRPGVLISVGMLTEGVDLPDARTAFLARPTVSRVLMQQMIGRVLRGPKAGGERDANVVYLRDQWEHFGDVLEPGEVVEQPTVVRRGPGGEERPLPPIISDDDGNAIPSDAAYQAGRQLDAGRQGAVLDDGDPGNDRSLDPILTTSSLCGFYQLPDRTVPVFDHQRDGYAELLSNAAAYDLKGTPFLSYFQEQPPPYPTQRTLRELVDYTREFDEEPEFIDLNAHIGPAVAADRVETAGKLDVADRSRLVAEIYDTSIARHVYPTLAHFRQAVDAELFERLEIVRRRSPESPLIESPPGAKKLPRVERDLDPIVHLAVTEARRILPPEHRVRLDNPPEVKWTSKVNKTTLGHWSINLTGRNSGRQIIRINTLLQTRSSAVPDEMIAYLVYHELLHHLLPGQGHDAEFRLLESLWPEATELNLAFDTLHERWDNRPESYNR